MKIPINIHRYIFFRKSISVLAIIFVITTLVLIIVGFIYHDMKKEKTVNDQFEYLTAISNFKTSQINDWLNQRYNQLELIRANSPLISKMETLRTSSNNLAELRKWFDALQNLYQYDDIILADPSSKIIYHNKPSTFQIGDKDSLLCKNCEISDSILFSDSDEENETAENLKFYVPLSSVRKQTKIVLILSVKPEKIFNVILNLNIAKSSTMESILVKPFKEGIVYLNTPKFFSVEEELDSNRKALMEANVIKSRKGFFVEGIDYKNDKVIALYQGVTSTTWTLITKINRSEFYAPANELAKLVILSIISIDLFFFIILFFIYRKSILTNYKKMYAAEVEKSRLENRFESLVKGVKDIAIFILDQEGKIISWNQGAGIIEGYSSEEILGKHFSIFYSEDEINKKKPVNNLNVAVQTSSYQEEGWRLKKDGSLYWANVLITALQDKGGNVYGFLKIIRDLTQSKKNEEEIKNSRDFYLKLLNGFPNPVWISGLDGKCNYFNEAWLKYTCRNIEEELGDGWISNLHPDEQERVVRTYYEAFRQMKDFIIEYRLKNFNGEYRWMINFGMPYFDLENKFAGYLGSCYDIDDRKKYEETINTLLRIGEKLYSSLEINQILDSLVMESIQLANAEGGFACVKNNGGFVVNRYYHKDHWEYFEKQYQATDKSLNRFASNGDETIFADAPNLNTIDQELVNKYNIRQAISVPLFNSESELIGFFEIHNKKINKGFNKDDINLLSAFARSASISIMKSMNYEQLRKAEKQLRDSESGLRNLAAQLQYARETERQKIAREVHDELGQLFTGINLNISLLTELIEQNKRPTSGEIIEELHSVQKFVDRGIQSVRDISGSLRSYVLDHLGLVPAVQEYCREIERMSNIKCNFNSEVDSFNFNDERNVALFRIIQEGITNILRHAEATIIDVTINLLDANLEIIIADNGKGIADEKEITPKSMGILGMKERAIFLDGKLQIDSDKNKGTTIHLSVPLE